MKPNATIQFKIEGQVAEGGQVMMRWTARGTHQGEFLGVPATGKHVTETGIFIDGVVDGKLQEAWAEWSALGMMQQLGVVPPLG